MIQRLINMMRNILGRLPPRVRLPLLARLDVWLGSAEPENIHVPQAVPSNRRRLALDVGANNGVTTFLLARLFERVVALEPNPVLAADLEKAGLANVTVHAVAASDHDGMAELMIPVSQGVVLSGWGSLDGGLFEPCDQIQRIPTPTATIDGMNLPCLDYMKIDVEGHEMAVLKGAAQTIARCAPWLVIEALDDKKDQVQRFLTQFGYIETTLEALTGHVGSAHNLIFLPPSPTA